MGEWRVWAVELMAGVGFDCWFGEILRHGLRICTWIVVVSGYAVDRSLQGIFRRKREDGNLGRGFGVGQAGD